MSIFAAQWGLISSFADCTVATVYGFLVDVEYLMWCLTIYSDFSTSSETRQTAGLTILWNRRGSQRKETHRTGYFHTPAVLGSPFYCLYYHTLHVTGKEKAPVFISLEFRGWYVFIRNHMKWKRSLWEPTCRGTVTQRSTCPCIKGSQPFLIVLAK